MISAMSAANGHFPAKREKKPTVDPVPTVPPTKQLPTEPVPLGGGGPGIPTEDEK